MFPPYLDLVQDDGSSPHGLRHGYSLTVLLR